MGGVNVKNTIVERVLQIVAPHPCSGCGKIGSLLCDDCKYDIIHEPFLGCVACGTPESNGICVRHHSAIKRVFVVGQRTDTLETLINRLKFQNAKEAARSLGQLLHESLPLLPEGIQIVPIPTVGSHIRRRGYDQVELIARHLSALRGIPIRRKLVRVTTATQHTSTKDERLEQSKQAFALNEGIALLDGPILLLDDIVTTSSTLSAAAQLLNGSAVTIWAAALAYQPLD